MTLCSILIIGIPAYSYEEEHHDVQKKAVDTKPDAKYAWKVNWNTLTEGIKISSKLRKPMIVDFGIHEGCERCEFLQTNVYSKDSIVAKINKDFIPIFVDLSKELTPEEQALGNKHEFHDDCMLLFLNYKKAPIFDAQGGKMCFIDKIEPEAFIRYLDYVINIHSQLSSN